MAWENYFLKQVTENSTYRTVFSRGKMRSKSNKINTTILLLKMYVLNNGYNSLPGIKTINQNIINSQLIEKTFTSA
jgi:hypothetical protein